ncbi:uncharacterized protein [Pagrus major]|uniref:uncharacterized protein n=1 Tax=Pagrus major TaxID=143350 RepID=UPI003CC86DF1
MSFVQQAGSEGELCQADSLGSAGSSSTLASSVIEVEAERPEPGLTLRTNREEEEDEEEELTPLSPPPTLSITEEILEFINQSRAREGLTAIHADSTEDRAYDQPKDSQPPPDQTNFTCPLPPVASPSSPEQSPTMQQEQERAEMENSSILQSLTGDCGEENVFEDETTAEEVKETPDATSQVEKGVMADGEAEGGAVEEEQEEMKTRDEEEGESIIPALTSDLHPPGSAEEGRESSSEVNAETSTSSPNPDLLQAAHRRQPLTRGSHLTKRDKKIIEKIRSYYEAAAEAEEDEAGEEEEQGEEAASRRRNSFSQIPSGLVKESVSRFDVGGHQGEPEGEQSKDETSEATGPDPPAGPVSPPTPLLASAEKDGPADKPISSLDADAITSPISDVTQDKKTPNQEDLILQPNPNPVGEEAEIQDDDGKVCEGQLEENQKEETSVVAAGLKCTDETTRTSTRNQTVMNGHEPNQAGPAELNGSCKEPPKPQPPSEQKTETQTQSSWARTKHRDLAKTSRNIESLPSQIKVGRWSHHSRIVTANRALFESMGSDVAGIVLFEAGPVQDPLLMENSERILSKVQTLAQMYSTKASTMKVPLHQKRAGAVRNPSWGSGRLSGHSAQTQTKSLTQIQTSATQNQKETISQSDQTKYRTQTHSEAKVQSQTLTQTRQQSKIQTKSQMLAQTKIYSQTMSQEDQTIHEETTIRRAESLTDDFQEEVMGPCDPLLFGHVLVKEQLTPACQHQTNGFTLSRPRDFISALTKERDSIVDCSSGDNSQTSTTPGGNPSTVLANSYNPGYISSDAAEASGHRLGAQLRDQSSSSSSTSTSKIRDYCSTSSTGRDEASNQNGEVYSDTEEAEKRERSELTDGCPVDPIRADSTQPAHSPNLSAHSEPPSESSKDGDKIQDKLKPEDESSAGRTYNQDVQRPEYLVCSGLVDGEASPGELVPTVASTQNQDPAEDHRSTVSHPQLAGDEAHTGILHQVEEGAKTQREKDELTKSNETKNELKESSSQTRMILQGSAVMFTEEPAHYRTPGGLTFDPSQVVTETPEDHKARAPGQRSWAEPNLTQTRPPSVQSVDVLPTFTSQRPPDLPTATGKRAPSNTRDDCHTSPYEHSSREPDQQSPRSPTGLPSGSHPSSRPYPAIVTPGRDADLATAPSAFRPNLRQRNPSPVRVPPPSSPFRIVPASSPTPVSAEDTSLNSASRAPPCFSPTPSSSLRSPPCSSPTASSSAFSRSLAASCISQSISQSIARKNTALQQAPPTSQSPSSDLRQRSPSPKLPPGQQGSSTPAHAQLGCSKDGYQRPRCPPTSLWSSCPSPSLMQSPPPSLTQRSPSPTVSHHPRSSSPSPRPSFLHSKTGSSHNANNNNNNSTLAAMSCSINRGVSNGGWSVSPQKAPLANGSTNATVMQQTHDPLWSGSHNRVARPFSASEPSSRVQSPSPSPTPASFTRLCSPPPQHNYSSPMANKPPHPRSTRVGGTSSHNPLGLTLELPRASSASSALGQSSLCPSPRILSPPPIGVSMNVWTNNVAVPQPRNPRYAPSSPSPSFASSLGSPTLEHASFPTSSSVSLRSSRASSPSASQMSQTLRRSFSSTLAETPSSPARSNPSGLRRSWAESSRRSLGFSGSGRGSFDQQESCPTSPRSGWSSYSSSPSCLSPRAGLQSPLSPSRLTPGKGTLGGQHFTSVPWPDVRELSNKYNGTDSLDASASSTIIASSPTPSDTQTDWGDPELEEGNCRSQLICAYVARPSRDQNHSTSCVLLSSSGMTSPPPVPYQHHNYQSQVQPQSQVQIATMTPPMPSVPSPSPSSSSPLPFGHASPTKQGNQKTSYATTVNLKIAGSGRITSFSTAQVSLTQTLQGGVGAGAGGPGPGQVTRRVSINGLSHLPSPLPS